jgi:hypothetical protein
VSRKHNTKHPNRGLSNYPKRLARRGHVKSPTMQTLAALQKMQRAVPTAPSFDMYAGWDYVDMSGV